MADQVKSISYYFDRVRFNVYFDTYHLLSIPELRNLNRRKVINVLEAYPIAQRRFHSRIEATAPTNATLDIIEKAIHDCYKSILKYGERNTIEHFFAISKVEIARDFIVDKESEANLLADRLMSMTGKKYTSSFKIYDAENDPRKHDKKADQRLKEEIFSTRIGYWGNQNRFEYVVYGRKSKINKLPSAHTEWRIIGANNIRKKTGIKSIRDMKDFDFKKFFEENDKKFMVYETIDHAAIGRWYKGIDGRRKLKGKLKMREEISNAVTGQLFCSGQRIKVFYKKNSKDKKPEPCKKHCRKDDCQSLGCEIRSAAALKQYLNQNKGKIKNVNGKILGNDKHRFFIRTAITIADVLKLPT